MNDVFTRSVAVFPLPDIAVLPGEVIPLQIFEPRYRRMIDEIEANDYLLGVSMAEKVIHQPELKGDTNPLQRNQTLYEPKKILGCGPIVITERLEDKRVMIELHVQNKVEVIEYTQNLPFYLAKVKQLQITSSSEKESEKMLAQDIKEDFLLLVSSFDANASMTIQRQIQDLDLEQLVVFVLGLIRFSGNFKQSLLEQDSWFNCGKILLNKLPELFPRTTH
tara:strand:+ start:686 stop:1348 length:663 start_codon:yes stop_codon:yes gene_type:complete